MKKTILITGSTDGIGLETAKLLVADGHHVLIHGRNPSKLEGVKATLQQMNSDAVIEGYVADLSDLQDVEQFAKSVAEKHSKLDVLINNAGVYNVPTITTKDNLDVRFVVNTIAPYLLTKKLLPLFDTTGRIVNLSSAAQSTVSLSDLISANAGPSDGQVYAQTKLAITMWSTHLAEQLKGKGPLVVAVNPASFLGSKLVKEAYGVAGNDLSIGADILHRAALSDEFSNASGKYFDNDAGRFSSPHSDALNAEKNAKVVAAIESLIA
ncbi:SDR family NAD(P)-dependent oxidoreductase [Vibrio methylphosphonaticus]|uniref:SDR family NAD(P)-dependent oxidoreductase n=1 Tax=Vibrio methylphosphonaticus TaxID=2946866 RepID=UPI00202A8D6D|nr:SDR family NAD(P)-dependent oxidoreductase [Vibrio methylphosphonaticus]MCL9774216.1 SDR family NAD(P)-dependent oxidoreductase [Vibrio methylphosphonaticus]